MHILKQLLLFTMSSMIVFFPISAATPSSLPGSTPTKIPPVTLPKKPPPQAVPPVQYTPPPKPVVPPMEKPFGMPGVVGLRDGKWEGTDYLGHLSNNISIDIEVLKGDKSPVNVDTTLLHSRVADLLKDEGINPRAEVSEGPPLPFLHILVIVYPIEKDKFVIFTTCRLFEEIQVMRKNFKPAGYWQGITWENQDISLATVDQLSAQVRSSVENLITAFIQRYRLYNKEESSGLPAAKQQVK